MRYIDADKLVEALQAEYDREGAKADDMAIKGIADASVKYSHGQFCYLNAIERVKDTPTADVVPKSEHERLAKEFESLETLYNEKVGQVKQLKEDIEGYRAELESEHLSRMDNIRELRAEIERLEHILNCYALQYGTVMDKHIVIEKAKAEVARKIFEEIENRSSMWGGERHINYKRFAELKKKYTEKKECPKCRYFVGCEKAVWTGMCDEYDEAKKDT